MRSVSLFAVLRKKIPVISVLAFLVLLAWPQSAYAQTSYWAEAFGGTGDDSEARVQHTLDGGYIVLSTTASFGAGDRDAWLVKLDGNGVIEWQRTYGGTGYELASAVLQTADGGYVVAGNKGPTSNSAWDAWVFRVDNDGDIQWEHTYGVTGQGNGAFQVVICMSPTSDGGYIVGGRTNMEDATRSTEFWALKLDSDGNRQWDHTYGGPAGSEERRIESILQTSDGGYIFGGTTLYSTPASVWVIKVDADGDTVQWQKTYIVNTGADLEDMQRTNDGGYVLIAETWIFPQPEDWWVFKIDSQGNIQWEKTYGGTGNEDAQPLLTTSDGGYLLAGSTTSFGVAGMDVWLVKLDGNGIIEWQRSYGGAGDDEVWSIDETPDGGYVAAAESKSFGIGGWDVWVLRLDSDGNIPDCEPIRTTDATVTTTHATVGEQPVTISSVDGQMEAQSTITVTSVAPIVQCFVPAVVTSTVITTVIQSTSTVYSTPSGSSTVATSTSTSFTTSTTTVSGVATEIVTETITVYAYLLLILQQVQRAVGGFVESVNEFAVLAPWLAIIGLVGCIGIVVVGKKRWS